MTELVTLSDLASEVNEWCEKHSIAPANGQTGEQLSERNLRYYRTLGLIDPPLAGGGQGYGEKHRLQLMAIRILQAQGLPLNKIRQLLFARTVEDLRQVERMGLAELKTHAPTGFRPSQGENWSVFPLGEEFMLVSRRGKPVTEETREELLAILNRQPVARHR